MNKQETKQFIENLFKEVWSKPNPDLIDKYYHKDLEAVFGNQKVNYDDVKNRAIFAKAKFSKIENDFQDIIVDENKVAMRLHQTSHMKDGSEPLKYLVNAIYYLRDDKIEKIWFIADKPIDYREKV